MKTGLRKRFYPTAIMGAITAIIFPSGLERCASIVLDARGTEGASARDGRRPDA
jgi:hypothetical protein